MPIVQIAPPVDVADNDYKYGSNTDVDAFNGGTPTDVDIVAYDGLAYLPDVVVPAASIAIVSDNANDDVGGTGAISVQIFGLATDFTMQDEIVLLDGLNPVNPELDYIRVNRMRVFAWGALRENAGNISMKNAANFFALIPAGASSTLQAVYTVPADYNHAQLLWWLASLRIKAANSVDMKLNIREFGGGWIARSSGSCSDKKNYFRKPDNPIIVPAKADIKMTAFDATADNQRVSAEFEFYLKRVQP